jgi:hypothetical protein
MKTLLKERLSKRKGKGRNVMNLKSLLIASALGASLIAAAPLQAAWPADHLAQAQAWVNVIKADNNDYDENPDIWVDAGGDLHAITKCGSFTALLLKNSYTAVTDAVLTALTGEASPHAANWYAAIDGSASDPVSGIAFHKRVKVADIAAGDILAAEYAEGSDDTGHAMTVASITKTNSNITPPYSIPGVSKVNKYRVTVYDSTKFPHGSYATNPYPDTRYQKQLDPVTNAYVDDRGLGSGTIVIYENPADGALVAWAWNVSATTASFYYSSVAPPAGSTKESRPMVAGALTGL